MIEVKYGCVWEGWCTSSVSGYEALTWHQRCRTHIRCGEMQGMPLPARPAASRRVMPCGFWSVLADSRRCGFDSGQFALNRANLGRIDLNRPYRPIQAEIQKRKKRCKTHRLSQILNPTFNSLHTNTSNKLSTSLSLHHSSLTLSVLSVDISACCETLSQCRVSHLTHFSSFLLQLSLSLMHS